jgi:hypothetical protein
MEMVDQVKKVLEYNSTYLTKINEESLYVSNNKSPTLQVTESLRNLNEIKSHIEDKIMYLKNKINQVNSTGHSTPQNKTIKPKEIIKLNYQKFSNLKKESFLKLMGFFDNYDLSNILTINRIIKFKIIQIVLELCEHIAQNFNNCYLRYLRSDNNLVTFTKTTKEKGTATYINLIIRAQITSNKLYDKTVNIGFKSRYLCDTMPYQNIMRFDVFNGGPLSFWVMRELTMVHLSY